MRLFSVLRPGSVDDSGLGSPLSLSFATAAGFGADKDSAAVCLFSSMPSVVGYLAAAGVGVAVFAGAAFRSRKIGAKYFAVSSAITL